MMAHAGEARNTPALDGAGDDAERLACAKFGPTSQRVLDLGRIMAVDHHCRPGERFGLALEFLPTLRFGDEVALAKRVAVHDRDHVGKLMIGDEIHRLPDLPLTGLAVADDAVDGLVQTIDPRGCR